MFYFPKPISAGKTTNTPWKTQAKKELSLTSHRSKNQTKTSTAAALAVQRFLKISRMNYQARFWNPIIKASKKLPWRMTIRKVVYD